MKKRGKVEFDPVFVLTPFLGRDTLLIYKYFRMQEKMTSKILNFSMKSQTIFEIFYHIFHQRPLPKYATKVIRKLTVISPTLEGELLTFNQCNFHFSNSSSLIFSGHFLSQINQCTCVHQFSDRPSIPSLEQTFFTVSL